MTRWNFFSRNQHKCQSVPYTREQLKEFFKQRDVDHNNLLSKAEVKKIFEDLESHFPWFRTWQAMTIADANGDGNIDQKELDDLLDFVVGRNYLVKA